MDIISSTISGNFARSNDAGIYRLASNLNLKHSTIANNLADSENHGTSRGGGVFGSGFGSPALDHAIVALNLRGAPRATLPTADLR